MMTNKKFLCDGDKLKQLVSLFNDGVNLTEIGRQFSVSDMTIRRILKNNGINPNRSALEKFYIFNGKKCIADIIEKYEKGAYPSDIAKDLQISQDKVRKVLRQFDKYKGRSKRRFNTNRLYHVDETFFAVIDTEEKAYWLGFLYADGYNQRGCRITINLSRKDEAHLEKFKKSIKSDQPLYYRVVKIKKANEVVRLDLNSVKISLDLEKNGMMQAKSLILTWPTFLPPNLYRHFIRGYFDGDGWITKSKTALGAIGFCGSHDFIRELQKYLIDTLKLNNNKIRLEPKNKRISIAGWTGKNVVSLFYDYFYKDASVWLDRKKQRFDTLVKA